MQLHVNLSRPISDTLCDHLLLLRKPTSLFTNLTLSLSFVSPVHTILFHKPQKELPFPFFSLFSLPTCFLLFLPFSFRWVLFNLSFWGFSFEVSSFLWFWRKAECCLWGRNLWLLCYCFSFWPSQQFPLMKVSFTCCPWYAFMCFSSYALFVLSNFKLHFLNNLMVSYDYSLMVSYDYNLMGLLLITFSRFGFPHCVYVPKTLLLFFKFHLFVSWTWCVSYAGLFPFSSGSLLNLFKLKSSFSLINLLRHWVYCDWFFYNRSA